MMMMKSEKQRQRREGKRAVRKRRGEKLAELGAVSQIWKKEKFWKREKFWKKRQKGGKGQKGEITEKTRESRVWKGEILTGSPLLKACSCWFAFFVVVLFFSFDAEAGLVLLDEIVRGGQAFDWLPRVFVVGTSGPLDQILVLAASCPVVQDLFDFEQFLA